MYTEKDRHEDFHWFIDNYDTFYNKYGKSFIVIKNKVVLGVYNDFITALTETTKIYSQGTFIIQECDGTEDAYIADVPSIFLF